MVPDSGARIPEIRERRVVLPQPDGPTIEVNEPGCSWKDIFDKAGISPFDV